MSALESALTIAGLVAITLLTRGFFVLPRKAPDLPEWLRSGLRHAPLAALVALVLPDILLSNGQLISTWREPRLAGAVAAVAWLAWRRDMLGTILVGTSVMLICRLVLGW